MGLTWVIEPEAFSESYTAFAEAIEQEGHRRISWNDDWWESGRWPKLDDTETVVFHGSLGNAHRVAHELDWRPGAFCATEAFHCTAWYGRAQPWLVQEMWTSSTVEKLIASPHEVAGHLATDDKVFVRPDSPLKPFSGRVCSLTGLTLEDLDFGFYYEEKSLPVVIAPLKAIGREWRFVVADREVVAHSTYDAGRRAASAGDALAPNNVAVEIARELEPPESVYVLDLCETAKGIRLLEVNPFSGADFYGCDPLAVVRAVSAVAQRSR